jgi:hypothetical protein
MAKTVPIACLILGLSLVALLFARGTAQQDAAESGPDIEHGRYIVHNVCLCTVCHSPRDANGHVIDSLLLSGGTIPVGPPRGQDEWALEAPKIAGLPAGWTGEEVVHFLQTGKAPHDRAVRPPMPPFRLNEADARAVVAYLQSIR